jgi:hypothetical protein
MSLRASRRKSWYALRMSEDPEIHALLSQAQAGSETVQELAFDCLQQCQRECGSIFERHQLDTAHQLLATGQENPHLATKHGERLSEARAWLKEGLKNLLQTAKEKAF